MYDNEEESRDKGLRGKGERLFSAKMGRYLRWDTDHNGLKVKER